MFGQLWRSHNMATNDTPEARAFSEARRLRVIKGANGKFCELDADETGHPYVVREFEPVVMAEVNEATGVILSLTRLEFSDAYHRQGITEVHKCRDGCHDVNLTTELDKPRFARMELHEIVDGYKFDARTETLVPLRDDSNLDSD
jgi:hypothetical protein